ncbi:MAG: YIP1 family protein [Anaeromyxobacteraceae bacterium]
MAAEAEGAGTSELEAPWVERRTLGLVAAWRETFRLVAFKPGAFFESLKIDRSGTAALFGLVSGSIGLFVASFWSALNRLHWWDASRDVALQLGPGGSRLVDRYLPYLATGFSLAEALTAPVKVLVGLFLGAVAIHAMLVLLRAHSRGFDATLTVAGYAFGLTLLLAVPVCGFPLVAVWLLAALVFGVQAAQRCALWQAAVAVLTPGLVVILFGIRPWLAGMFTLVKTFQLATGAGGQ